MATLVAFIGLLLVAGLLFWWSGRGSPHEGLTRLLSIFCAVIALILILVRTAQEMPGLRSHSIGTLILLMISVVLFVIWMLEPIMFPAHLRWESEESLSTEFKIKRAMFFFILLFVGSFLILMGRAVYQLVSG
jgi:hypothetical protein